MYQQFKGEIVNLKNIVIKRLQDENEKLRAKCSTLENKEVSVEQNLNVLGRYSRRNNLVFCYLITNWKIQLLQSYQTLQ